MLSPTSRFPEEGVTVKGLGEKWNRIEWEGVIMGCSMKIDELMLDEEKGF